MRLSHYTIDEARCIRCGRCERVCPHGAIGRKADPSAAASDNARNNAREAALAIDQHRCQRCGMCFRACPASAVRRPYCLTTLREISTTGHGE